MQTGKKQEAQDQQAAAAAVVEEVINKSVLDLVMNTTEDDLVGPDETAEAIKGNAKPATGWLHAPAVFEFSAVAYKRLQKVAEWAGMKHLDIPKIQAKFIGKSKVLVIKPANESDRTAYDVQRHSGKANALVNLFALLGTHGLTEPTGYRERFDVIYVPKGSPHWPGLLIDLGAPKERREEPQPKKKPKPSSAEKTK